MLVQSNLDLNKNSLLNPRVHPTTPAPSSPVAGQLWYDTSVNKLYYYNGTAWIDCTGGTASVSDATTSAKGIVQLAGDLAGTAASPQIAAGVIVDADVAAANKDGQTTTPSLRTLGTGAQQALPGNARISQLGAAQANVDMGNYSIINLIGPTNPADAANKQYVDNTAQGLDAKQSVKAASTANLTLSGTQTVDGVALIVGDRILVKDQTTQANNGIYGVASGSWLRSTDADTWTELPGSFVFVEQGTVNADSGWVCTSDQGGTLNTTAVTWTQFSGAGQITDGLGLLKTGNTLDVRVDGTTIAITSDILGVAPGAIVSAGGARYYSSATHGAGTNITIAQATHGCRASRGLIVQCRVDATGEEVLVDTYVAATGDVTVQFAVSQTANTIRTTIIG